MITLGALLSFMLLRMCVFAAPNSDTHARAPFQFVFSNTTLLERDRGLSALYDGQDSVYLFGGQVQFRSVRKYSISRDIIEEVGEWGPGLQDGGAVLDPEGSIYYFGGKRDQNGREVSDIWKVDANLTATLIGELPHALMSMGIAAAANTEFVYLFGGRDRNGHRDEILRYSTLTNSMELVGTLPRPYSNANAIFDPESGAIYLIGGHNSLEAWTQILKFDTRYDVWSILEAKLPSPTTFSCTVWTGTDAYTIGGHDLAQGSPRLRRFRPSAGTVEDLPINGFPRWVSSHSCVYVPHLHRVYSFGGFVDSESVSSHIAYIDLPWFD